ncbi:HPP family protein [Mesobacillus foraminis]|uniref:HPP family protein n=1 Tax=Mesobacillus foraminis TaxID=279826 RepID=UPI0039A129B1
MAIEKSFGSTLNHQFVMSVTAYLKKMRGQPKRETSIDFIDSLVSATGGLIAISILSILAVYLGYPMALAPIGASCVLVFGAHKGPLSQPRHVIGGHFISAASALIIWEFLGKSLFTIAIALAVVLILMAFTHTVHPPAAASALVAINSEPGWGFLLPIVICPVLLVIISTFYNNLFHSRQYPKYWM